MQKGWSRELGNVVATPRHRHVVTEWPEVYSGDLRIKRKRLWAGAELSERAELESRCQGLGACPACPCLCCHDIILLSMTASAPPLSSTGPMTASIPESPPGTTFEPP